MTETFSAADNPDLANQLVAQVTADQEELVAAPVAAPSGTQVELIAGKIDHLTGTTETSAEIRELNGLDEEAIGKIDDLGKALLTILERGVVKVGDEKATPRVLDDLLAADRELLLLEIRKATFGNDLELSGPCPHCDVSQDFVVDLTEDISVKRLENPIADLMFDVQITAGVASVTLPLGSTQKKLIAAANKSSAELDTLLLKECVSDINGQPVVDARQVQNLSIKDRRKILDAITDKNPGPQLADVKKKCSACGQEVPLPLTLAYLFRTW